MTRTRTAYIMNTDHSAPCYTMVRNWEVQKRPYKNPLPYGFEQVTISGSHYDNRGNVGYYGTGEIIFGAPGRESDKDYALNACYAKLSAQLGDPSQWVNNLLEANEAIGGAAARITQIARFAGKLRKGNIVGAARELGAPVPGSLKGKKAKVKTFGDQFLEFHFGWVPLAQDIHAAMQTLSEPDFDSRKLKAFGHSSGQWLDRNVDGGGGWIYIDIWSRKADFRAKCGCTVRVNNPNAYLANQLGLINPASVAWEAVPYSFVVDWFANVGQVIASMSDFVGLDVSQAYTTVSTELNVSYVGDYHDMYGPSWAAGKYGGRKYTVSRSLGVPTPVLKVKPFKGLSLTRGVTAISLLLQKL